MSLSGLELTFAILMFVQILLIVVLGGRFCCKRYKGERESITVGESVLGYKKTVLLLAPFSNENDTLDLTFEGLVGAQYSANDIAKSHYGFHMYKTLDQAQVHAQGVHSTFLEVVGYSNLEEHSDGYTSDRQRVLQVIIGKCFCGQQATYLWSDGAIACEECVYRLIPTRNLDFFAEILTDLRKFMLTQQTVVSNDSPVNIVPIHGITYVKEGSVYRIPGFVPSVETVEREASYV